MTTKVEITKKLENGSYLVEAKILPGGELPLAIFLFENTGKPELGPFYAPCTLPDLIKFQEFKGEMVPIFGNRFLRGSVAKIILKQESEVDTFVTKLLTSIQSLKLSYTQKTSETTIHTLT